MTSATVPTNLPADLDPVYDRLLDLKLAPRLVGETIRALCPVHEADGAQHTPSASFFIGRNAQWMGKCHAGCATRDVMRAVGHTGGTPLPNVARAKCPTLPLANVALLQRWDDDSPAPGAWQPHRADWPTGTVRVDHVASYRYPDLDNRLIGVRDRFHFLGNDGARIDKTFRQRCPVREIDRRAGRETVRWRAPSRAGVALPLFGWPRLLDRVEGAPVYVTEGEKDALALNERGLCAVTAPDGASGWRECHTTQLREALLPREVVRLIGDDDGAGASWRSRLIQELAADVTVEVLAT